MGPIGGPDTSVRYYQYSLRNKQEERSSQRWSNLKRSHPVPFSILGTKCEAVKNCFYYKILFVLCKIAAKCQHITTVIK